MLVGSRSAGSSALGTAMPLAEPPALWASGYLAQGLAAG